MNTVAKILGNKLFALAGLVSVGISLLVVPAVTGGLGANPLEKLLHQSGEIAIWTLGSVLALSPLRVLLPRSRVVAALNRHRRAIGVSACMYGLLHFGFHVLYEGGWDGLMRSLSKPFIWFGLSGLSILVVLALTSNNWSIRTLGGKNWKLLHRFAYVAAALLIYHQAIAGKGHWHIARWLLFLLATLQLARLIKTAVRENPEILVCHLLRNRLQAILNLVSQGKPAAGCLNRCRISPNAHPCGKRTRMRTAAVFIRLKFSAQRGTLQRRLVPRSRG